MRKGIEREERKLDRVNQSLASVKRLLSRAEDEHHELYENLQEELESQRNEPNGDYTIFHKLQEEVKVKIGLSCDIMDTYQDIMDLKEEVQVDVEALKQGYESEIHQKEERIKGLEIALQQETRKTTDLILMTEIEKKKQDAIKAEMFTRMTQLEEQLRAHENVWQGSRMMLASESTRLINIKETGSLAIDELMGKMSVQMMSANDVVLNDITKDKLSKIIKIAVDAFAIMRRELRLQGSSHTTSVATSSSVSSRPGLQPPQPPYGSDSDESFSRWSNEALTISRKRSKMDESGSSRSSTAS